MRARSAAELWSSTVQLHSSSYCGYCVVPARSAQSVSARCNRQPTVASDCRRHSAICVSCIAAAAGAIHGAYFYMIIFIVINSNTSTK